MSPASLTGRSSNSASKLEVLDEHDSSALWAYGADGQSRHTGHDGVRKQGRRSRGGQALRQALDAGVNVFDAANVYAGGRSEQILGRLIGSMRDRLILGTKFAVPTDNLDPNSGGTLGPRSTEQLTGQLVATEVHLNREMLDRIDAIVPPDTSSCRTTSTTASPTSGRIPTIGSNQNPWVTQLPSSPGCKPGRSRSSSRLPRRTPSGPRSWCRPR
jgi:hypothetical protein